VFTNIKRLAHRSHKLAAGGPVWFAHWYLTSLGCISRQLPAPASQRLGNSVAGCGASWPNIKWTARRVILGDHTEVAIHPHLGEFDQDALFMRRLGYEASTFRWLENHAAKSYDAIIEIGANVGIFSIFFDKLSRQPGARLKRIVSFEPSPEAYRRLTANLNANACSNVAAYPVAVGAESGFQTFNEPKGHLTNGSFSREFAQIFSDTISAIPVMVFAANALRFFFEGGEKLLMKIDVEGYEPELLQALTAIITEYQPDIIVEVLTPTEDAIEASPALASYQRFLLAQDGPVPFRTIRAAANWRDWLLQPSN
jgi:FkbM family methyltransferase